MGFDQLPVLRLVIEHTQRPQNRLAANAYSGFPEARLIHVSVKAPPGGNKTYGT